jgi:hypothetical protein
MELIGVYYVTAPTICHPKVNVSCQGQIPYFVHEKNIVKQTD